MSPARLGPPLLALGLVACGPKEGPPSPAAQAAARPHLTILAINDTYRIEGDVEGDRGGLARVRALRAQLEAEGEEVLLLHAGDLLFPSFLSRTFKGEQMIDVLSRLDGDGEAFDEHMFATFGNHEFDKTREKDAALLDARVEQSGFTWLASDLQWKAGPDGAPLVAADNLKRQALVRVGGVQVGLFSVTLPFVTPDYVAGYADPIETARARTAALRAAGAQVVVALTHQDLSADQALVEALGDAGPDLVVGGHEHARQSLLVQGRLVTKADADAWSASVLTVTPAPQGLPQVTHRFVDLAGTTPAPDPAVQAAVDGWIRRQEDTYCREKLQAEPGCLDAPLATAGVELVAAELDIRRFETNLGDWVADGMLDAWRDQGAQIAFVNAGALRINRTIAAGTTLTRREVEELLPYPSATHLVRLDRPTLDAVLARAVADWTGQGHFLQVAGIAFRHHGGVVSDLTLLGPDGPRPLGPDEGVLAVTVEYVANGGDGYTMLGEALQEGEAGPTVKELVTRGLQAQGTLTPAVEGRICVGPDADPCLAQAPADR